jgi:hypothetical protein
MKTFKELRTINVNQHIEKKGNLSYLSWAWAVDYLLQEDPTATWYFEEPKYFGETVMVSCTVAAMNKQMTMHLPVMDNKNQSVKNPDSRKISDAMMRCLAKCIATFGIGLYVYAGEDVPHIEDEPIDLEGMLQAIWAAQTLEELRETYIATVKTVKGNQDAMRQLEATKDARKEQLMPKPNEVM